MPGSSRGYPAGKVEVKTHFVSDERIEHVQQRWIHRELPEFGHIQIGARIRPASRFSERLANLEILLAQILGDKVFKDENAVLAPGRKHFRHGRGVQLGGV